jgi:hypothetical protein
MVDKLRFLGIYQIIYLDANKINSSKSYFRFNIIDTITDKKYLLIGRFYIEFK